MKLKRIVQINASQLVEEKLFQILARYFPTFSLLGFADLRKNEFRYLTSLLRFKPHEVLTISCGFRFLKVRAGSKRVFVEIQRVPKWWQSESNENQKRRKNYRYLKIR